MNVTETDIIEISSGDMNLPGVREFVAGFLACDLGMIDQLPGFMAAMEKCFTAMTDRTRLLEFAEVINKHDENPANAGKYVMRVFTARLSEAEGKGAHILDVLTGANRSAWLKSFDPEAFDGGGAIDLTDDITDAMRFPTWVAVADLWRTQSKVRPLRENGSPNCPLAAYTIQPERIDDDV